MPNSGDHGTMRELYENRYKLLRDDNQMLRENLRREQQVETSLFCYSFRLLSLVVLMEAGQPSFLL